MMRRHFGGCRLCTSGAVAATTATCGLVAQMATAVQQRQHHSSSSSATSIRRVPMIFEGVRHPAPMLTSRRSCSGSVPPSPPPKKDDGDAAAASPAPASIGAESAASTTETKAAEVEDKDKPVTPRPAASLKPPLDGVRPVLDPPAAAAAATPESTAPAAPTSTGPDAAATAADTQGSTAESTTVPAAATDATAKSTTDSTTTGSSTAAEVPPPPKPSTPAGGNGDASSPPPPADVPPPRGFEHFYDPRFSKQSETTVEVAYKGIDKTEEVMSRTVRQEQASKRRRAYLFMGFAGMAMYLVYAQDSRIVRAVLNSTFLAPNLSVKAIERAAEAAEQRRVLDAIVGGGGAETHKKEDTTTPPQQQGAGEGASSSAAMAEAEQDLALAIKESTRRIWINVDAHVAKMYDDAGHLLNVATFIDVRALKETLSAWRGLVVERRVKETAGGGAADDAAAASGGDDTTTDDDKKAAAAAPPEYEEVRHHKAPDMMYTVPSHFPFAAIAFLWLLPILVSVHRSLTMQVKAAGTAASKGPAGKPSRFKLQKDIKTKLADVAGLTEVKHEVVEIVHMLKSPMNYVRLGARVPRGVLIDGPPGVGKTLLAKAVAGEAGLPFISCSGSEFDEVYVGVGAKRVRELFATAKKHKPCIIFIDEIDTFGKKRRNDRSGSSRATINALLNELDGFTESNEIMVLAATNRADVLDEALTRSGRFDRKISVDLPPFPDRVAIAKVHLAPILLPAALTLDSVAETLATMTPGCSGADIYNICNEAAITASRKGKDAVDIECFTVAMDRIMIGMEKKANLMNTAERERLAFHEAGKVILSWFLETTDPVLKSTITPRGGRRSGVTKRLPKERFISTQTMLRERMIYQLGGYVTEEYFFDDVSSTAADDLRQVTNLAKHEVATYGMDPVNVGHFGWQENDQAIQKPYGNHKADQIDKAVEGITEDVMRRARELLAGHLDHVRIVAGMLQKTETVTARDLWAVLGERPHMSDDFRKYLETAAST